MNFGERAFASKRLAQGLSRSPTAFSAYSDKHFYACVASDRCFVYFDDLGSGAIDGYALIKNLVQTFVKKESLGFKLSIEKCEFGTSEINSLGHSITGDGIKPIKDKLENFLKTVKLPKSVKQLRRFIGFPHYFQKYIPKLAEKFLNNSLSFYERKCIHFNF